MAAQHLDFDTILSGLLIDGVADAPYTGATLRMSRDKGVTVEVPYLSHHGAEQFTHVQRWFQEQSPPTNMLLLTPTGTFALFDIAWSGHSENWGGRTASVGTLRPSLTVLDDREGELGAPLALGELRSRLDGLNEWSRRASVSSVTKSDEDGLIASVTVELDHDEGLSWRQGDATLTIRAGWFQAFDEDGYSKSRTIQDNAHIESRFDKGPMPFWNHFVEQRKIANLMVLLFGRRLSFREHQLRDDLFVSRLSNGKVYARPWVGVISRNTFAERRARIPSKKELGRPIAYMEQIGSEGLQSWSDNYEKWERFILPAVAVLGRSRRFIEDVVISNCMSLEAAGGILGERDGERVTWSTGRHARPTTATYIYRCLNVLNVEWPAGMENRVGLARAVASIYNDVKHYDRGDFPNHEESHVVSEVTEMIVRLLAIYITGRGETLLQYYRDGNGLHDIKHIVEAYGLSINADGRWLRTV